MNPPFTVESLHKAGLTVRDANWVIQEIYELNKERAKLMDENMSMRQVLQSFVKSYNLCRRPALCVVDRDKFEDAEKVIGEEKP